MKKSTSLIFAMVAVISVMVISCSKDTPAPTAEIFATIDGYTVSFNPTVTDVSTYAWDFGDDETSTEAKPEHTYAMSGAYTVTLVVKGEGGEATATKSITIAASFSEMLTGGPAATNGKTWVLSVTTYTGIDGGGPVTASMPVVLPAYDNILADYGLEAEYDNEFTFFDDGDFTMAPKNGNVLAGAVYAYVNGTLQGEPAYDIGMAAAAYTPSGTATWTMHTEDLVVDAITDPLTSEVPPVHADVTFTGKTWISISEEAYFGILDFPTTARFIVKELTPTKLSVALFLCGYGYGEDIEMMMLPTNMIHLTYIPKPTK
jgi:PKD repeat protein